MANLKITIGTFADVTVILTCHKDVHRTSSCLQEYLLKLQSWLQTWKIKITESKSTYLLHYEKSQAHKSI